MPLGSNAAACAWSSVYRELPPSMMMSSASSTSASDTIVALVGSPDGTITQTTRGVLQRRGQCLQRVDVARAGRVAVVADHL